MNFSIFHFVKDKFWLKKIRIQCEKILAIVIFAAFITGVLGDLLKSILKSIEIILLGLTNLKRDFFAKTKFFARVNDFKTRVFCKIKNRN